MEEIELILLPPKPRFECGECHKKFSKIEKCKDGELRCSNCKKKMVTNKWYVPYKQRESGFIGKYNMTNSEKGVLYKSFVMQGFNPEIAWRKVHSHCRLLKAQFFRYKGLEQIKKQRELNKIQMNKQFLEGLK